MKLITNDDVDNLYREISKFEKSTPGIKYGIDFPEFSLALAGANCFVHWQTRCIETGMFLPLIVEKLLEPKAEELKTLKEAGDAAAIKALVQETVLADNPYRQMFMKAIYLGYRLGKEYNTVSEGIDPSKELN